MSLQLISRSDDLSRLRNEGYDIVIEGGHLVVRDVPYVTPSRAVQRGMLISTLALAGDRTTRPDTHVVSFSGETPCKADGTPLSELIIATSHELANGLRGDYQFSHKPVSGYGNYFDKMVAYANILVSEANRIDPDATAMTFRVVVDETESSPFNYIDTASSRAGIAAINDRLRLNRIAIVGTGGTGSYILDLVAKTPVQEIHLFDGDLYLQHNAFRSPGAPTAAELSTTPKKVDYWAGVYGQMRRGIVKHPEPITEANVDALTSMDFVFLALDGGEAKRLIVARLVAAGVAFIDAGMGIYENNGKLAGLVVTTTASRERSQHAFERIPFSDGDGSNEYARNIQIAELNALNAALAVIKWKKLFGIYDDFEHEHYSVYAISDNSIVNDESARDENEANSVVRAADAT